MARVLIPVTPRQYNYNPRGSSTTQVLMRADNPFERGTTVVLSKQQQRGSMLPGMGELGDDPAPAAPAASDAWAVLAKGAVDIGQQVAAKQLAPKPIKVLPISTGMQLIPGQSGAMMPAPRPSKLPWILGSVGAVAGLGILIMVLKKRH